MKHPAHFNPIGKLKAGTIFETEPFNFVWDAATSQERFSFLVPLDAEETVHRCLNGEYTLYGKPLPPGVALKEWALAFIGREWDRYRLAGVSLRVVDRETKRIEVRMAFHAPWFLTEALSEHGGRDRTSLHAGGQELANAIQRASPMAGEFAPLPRSLHEGVSDSSGWSPIRGPADSPGGETSGRRSESVEVPHVPKCNMLEPLCEVCHGTP